MLTGWNAVSWIVVEEGPEATKMKAVQVKLKAEATLVIFFSKKVASSRGAIFCCSLVGINN